MNIKMIVTDLDGTLLKDDKSISEYTKSVLRQCREAGIKTVYATARREGSFIFKALDDLFDGSIICNGALGFIHGAEVFSRLITFQSARPFLIACDQRGLQVSSQRNGIDYANYIVSDVRPEVTNFTLVDFAQHDKDAEKLFIIPRTDEDIAYLESHLPINAYLHLSREGHATIMHKEAKKSKAVEELIRIWNISLSEVVAFGDDLNDTDLLTFAGIGVAVSNALDSVKEVANYICMSNEQDGVAKWLVENVLSD